jgi:hypothetical protein
MRRTRSFAARVAGALRLDAETYEGVEHDKEALAQALVIVVLSSLSTGIGSVRPTALEGFVTGTLFALAAWVVWSSLMYVIGALLLPQPQTEADVGQLMRTIGFASAPGLFGVLGVVPVVGRFLLYGVSVWMAAAMLLAVRQALDFTTLWRALAVVVIGWAAYLTILLLASRFF